MGVRGERGTPGAERDEGQMEAYICLEYWPLC